MTRPLLFCSLFVCSSTGCSFLAPPDSEIVGSVIAGGASATIAGASATSAGGAGSQGGVQASGASNAGGSGGAGGVAGTAGTDSTAGFGSDAGAGGLPALLPKSLLIDEVKRTTPKAPPKDGGAPSNDSCAAGEVLIGFNGQVDGTTGRLRNLSGVCAQLSLRATEPYTITTRQTQTLPARGPGGPTIKFAACPANQVVVGFSGYVLFFVDALTFKCAPLAVMRRASEYVLTFGETTDTATLGSQEFGTPFVPVDCLPDEVAVSQLVNAGDEIDSFALACSKVTLALE